MPNFTLFVSGYFPVIFPYQRQLFFLHLQSYKPMLVQLELDLYLAFVLHILKSSDFLIFL